MNRCAGVVGVPIAACVPAPVASPGCPEGFVDREGVCDQDALIDPETQPSKSATLLVAPPPALDPSHGLLVVVDSHRVNTELAQRGMRLVPGEHHIVFWAPGFQPYELHIQLRELERTTVGVQLEPCSPPEATRAPDAQPRCGAGYDENSGPDDLEVIARRDACIAHAYPKLAPRSLKALHVYVEFTSPRVPLGEKLSGIAFFQNEGEAPLEVWLDGTRPLEHAIRVVPDDAEKDGAAAPRLVVSKPEPCDRRAAGIALLHFVIRPGERIGQRFEWLASAEGTFRIDVRPAFATCVVDPTGASLDSAYFGVPGHP